MQAPEVAAARVRQPFLRGRQSIAAIWFPSDWFDSATQARRILSCWRAGATTLRFPQGDLLCYASAIEADCDALAGWPLRQEGRALSTAALTDLERASAPQGDVFIVLGAEVLALQMREGVPLDPAAWLEVQQLTLHETYDCTTPPPAPIVLDLETRPLREVLGNSLPPASAEQAEFLKAVQRAQDRGTDPAARPGVWSHAVWVVGALIIAALGAQGLDFIVPAMIGLFVAGMIRGLLGGRAIIPLLLGKLSQGAASSARAAKVANADSVPERRNKEAQPQRWRQWLARLAITSQVARLLGRAQARYLRRMLGLFDEGNLDEALRHAIPLGGKSLGQAFGTPRARSDLRLSTGGGAAASLHIGDELQNHLRSLYRRAFEKLDRQGRIDEAVFVLAELLDSKKEALDYLEKHERFVQAAELALGWDMPSDIIVRLYCLAGNWRRALAIARRDSAFANAVLQLEKKWPDVARRLRTEWGAALTQQGDWIGAVEAVWPDESLRSKAAEWLLTAEAAGGKLAARALVQRAVLLPDTLVKYADHLQELRSDSTLWPQRLNLAEALLSMGRGEASRELAAIVAPPIFADQAQGHSRFNRNSLQQLVKLSGDLLLQADLPNQDWPVTQPLPIAQWSDDIELEGPEAGAHDILDAVPLHDQHYLVALDEAGACVIDGSGRTRAHFAIPAQRLVISNSRQVALALARRESLWRVSRIDLAQRNIVDLGLGDFEIFGELFDGLHWTVTRGRRLQVLDTQQSLREVIWQVTDLPGAVTGFTTSATLEHVLLTAKANPTAQWIYTLPHRRLLSRDPLVDVQGHLRLLNPARGAIDVAIEETAPGVVRLRWKCIGKQFEYQLQTRQLSKLMLWIHDDWLVISSLAETGFVVDWVHLMRGDARSARVHWPGHFSPRARATGNQWLLFDITGRLMCFDVSDGQHQNVTVR